MNLRYVDNLIDDDEIPELTEADFAQMVPFHQLPEHEQAVLREIMAGNVTIRPDPLPQTPPKKPVTFALSTDILDRFAATGEGWEARVDDALRQWLNEHTLPEPHAKAS